MVDLQVTPDQQSILALTDMIKRLQDETGRSASDAVDYAAIRVAKSGGVASKPSKKNRDSIPNPEWKQARGSFAWARRQMKQGKAIPAEAQAALNDLNSLTPFLIVRMRQGGQAPLMMPSYEKKDPRRLIERRGLAKKTWSVMGAKLAASRGQDRVSSGGKDYRVSKYIEKYGDTGGSHVARLVNKLTYLEDAYPGITQTAITKGTNALKGELDRKIAAATARANK